MSESTIRKDWQTFSEEFEKNLPLIFNSREGNSVLKEIIDGIFKQYLKLVMNLNPYSWKIRHNYNSGDIYSTSTNEPKSQQTPETKVITIKKFYILCVLGC